MPVKVDFVTNKFIITKYKYEFEKLITPILLAVKYLPNRAKIITR